MSIYYNIISFFEIVKPGNILLPGCKISERMEILNINILEIINNFIKYY